MGKGHLWLLVCSCGPWTHGDKKVTWSQARWPDWTWPLPWQLRRNQKGEGSGTRHVYNYTCLYNIYIYYYIHYILYLFIYFFVLCVLVCGCMRPQPKIQKDEDITLATGCYRTQNCTSRGILRLVGGFKRVILPPYLRCCCWWWWWSWWWWWWWWLWSCWWRFPVTSNFFVGWKPRARRSFSWSTHDPTVIGPSMNPSNTNSPPAPFKMSPSIGYCSGFCYGHYAVYCLLGILGIIWHVTTHKWNPSPK